MQNDFISHFLPSQLLVHFEIEYIKEIGELKTKKMIFHIGLVEKKELPEGIAPEEYESKGFYETKEVQDFPIRGKAVYLLIKRRRWRKKEDKNIVISNDYSFITEGSKLTRELSDFLKGTGRDPRRYDK